MSAIDLSELLKMEGVELEAENILDAYRRECPGKAKAYDDAVERVKGLQIAFHRATSTTNPLEAADWAEQLERHAVSVLVSFAGEKHDLVRFAERHATRFTVKIPAEVEP